MATRKREMKHEIPTNSVKPNPENPRLIFSEQGMLRLIESIKESGILVPLTVYQKELDFIILDGERRWRAARKINLATVPCYVLPEPANRMEYLLSMFKIHNVREEWKLLPTALKLKQVIDQIKEQTGKKTLTNKELATITSLSPATVGRCRRLLTLPQKFQDLLFEEEKMAERGIKPTKTTLSEDFFLEMLRAIAAFESKKSGMQYIFTRYPKDEMISIFIKKFKKEQIPDITDFRYLTKIIKQTKLPVKTREKIVLNILEDVSYRIDYAYDVYVRSYHESQYLEKQFDRTTVILESLQVESLDPKGKTALLSLLRRFRNMLDSKILEVEKTAKEVSE